MIAKAPGAGHFGPTLVSYILYQYHHQHVTQPLLLEQLLELGVEISAGQLSQILTHGNDEFHQEKDAVLSAGIEVSRYLQSDDTGARHEGKNGYCTYIGNDLFAWFKSTQSKSRVNFLELLRAEQSDYVINAGPWSICSIGVYRRPRLPCWKATVAILATTPPGRSILPRWVSQALVM